MRRILALGLTVTAMALTGCAKPPPGTCKSSDDCKDQQGFGKICVQGQCQECGADTDCKAGFQCRDNKCTPRPECENDAACGEGKACQGGKCVAAAPKAECAADADCGDGKGCEAGKCVAKAPALSPSEEAAKCGGDENAVHFAFDRADLDETARGTLDKVAQCLKQVPAGAKVAVEGHCDERGTTDYNLQLGQRRAEAVRKYLTNLGVDKGMLRAVSYGKERPICQEHTEGCWQQNRRSVIAADRG